MATDDFQMTQAELIARRIREVRKIAELNQTEFAKIIGVSRSYLSEVEALKAKPSVEMIVGIANQFPHLASPYWLLLGYGVPGPYSERSISSHHVEWKSMAYALRLRGAMELPAEPIDRAVEVEAKVLTILVNAYSQAYGGAVERGGGEVHARWEGELRARELAEAMGKNMDLVIAIGPVMPF